MPLSQRIPKLPGFTNPFKKTYAVVNLSKLSRFADGAKVDAAVLAEAGLVRPGEEVKVLGTGELKRKLSVEAHAFSQSARTAIETRGGSVKVLGEPRKIGPRRTAAKAPKLLPTEGSGRSGAAKEPKPEEPTAEAAVPSPPKGRGRGEPAEAAVPSPPKGRGRGEPAEPAVPSPLGGEAGAALASPPVGRSTPAAWRPRAEGDMAPPGGGADQPAAPESTPPSDE